MIITESVGEKIDKLAGILQNVQVSENCKLFEQWVISSD